ncbi:MAG TPA: S9 family peptidase [Chthoniobacterales bacterium]
MFLPYRISSTFSLARAGTFFFPIVLVAVFFATYVAAADKRPVSEKDLFDFIWIGDPQISPDGSRVAFVRVSVNDKKLGYDTSIWSVATDGGEEPHRLTTGNHDSAPRWSPDGKYLCFMRAAEKEGKPEPPQLFMLPLTGGDAFGFTTLPKGVSAAIWSPDGKQIAFTSSTNPDDLAKQEKKKRREEELKKAAAQSGDVSGGQSPQPSQSPSGKSTEEGAHESDIHVITRAVYRSNDEGYLDPKHPQHVWIIQAPFTADAKVEPKQLTTGRFDESDPIWSKDGGTIYFASLHVDEPYYELPKSELYSIPASGGQPLKMTTIDMDINYLALSPDGKQIAFIAAKTQPVNSYTQPDLWTIELQQNAKPHNLTADFDYDVGNGVFGDSAPPRAGGINRPIWSRDGKSIIELFGKEGRTNLARFDSATGVATELTKGNQAVVRVCATADGSKLVYLASTPTRIGDLFTLDQSSAQVRQITDVNRELFSRLNLTEPEEIWYQSFDGKRIQAWLQKPPDFDAHKKYPLILNIHGGPHAAYGYIFEHEFQWMAAKGYIVLFPNPRGSTTYGQDFGNVIQYHYPGDDYQDLMRGVDEVVGRGYVDDKKLGVTGGSGGGLLTNWVVGHTQRFAAAVSQRDIASWETWWYTADFTLFQPNWFHAPPFDEPDEFKTRSPITYIKDVKTPLMLILGETDSRTPPGAGGEEMFRALKFLKIPTVMVKFPNETHDLSRSGQPWHRVERLQHIVGWFDHWLNGVAKPEYEVAPEREVSMTRPSPMKAANAPEAKPN